MHWFYTAVGSNAGSVAGCCSEICSQALLANLIASALTQIACAISVILFVGNVLDASIKVGTARKSKVYYCGVF